MQLTGPQRRQLQAALLSAFPSLADLAQMVAYELDQTLSTIAGSANLTEAVVNLVDWAAAHEQLAALIRGAISANPDNPQLPALAAELGVSTAVEERTAPGPAAPDLFRVPYPRDPFFVGREKELSTLDEALRRETRGHGVLPILVGPAGIGKTRLAAEFAYRVRDRFPGGIFWLAMDPPEGVAAQVAALGGPDALNLPGATTLPLADQVAAVRAAWQESIPRLLVFDNLADPALLDQWRPRGGGTRVLATSRLPTWDSTGEARPLVLAPLERGADQELLLTPRALELGVSVAQLLADPGQRRAADAISRELNNLPLALTLAGTYLKTYSGVSLDQYLGQLQAGRAAPPPVEAEGPPGPSPSLDAAFALSYDRLDPRQDVDSLAQTLLQRAAQCAPAPIPRRLLVRAAGLDPDAAPAAALAGQALDRLAALGLLEPLPEGELRLHPLLAAAVRRRALDPAGDTAAVEAALIAEVRIVRQAGYPLAGRPYLPHLRHAVAAAEPRGDATAAALLNTLGTLLQDQGDYAAARPLLERALTIYEATLGPTHRDTVASLNNLALLLQVQGDYAGARPLYERALTISEATLGPTHPDTAVGLNNLAGLLQDQGDYAVARPLYERALAICEATRGPT
ncbi:MAG TPA: tetratricopeptide repeat protein, partial [Chloroflexia bacterium]|nr:tetratricopeptide repeat protein [Chloroflexia bacterium]